MPISKVELLALVLGVAKLVKLEQKVKKFYIIKVEKFIKLFDKALYRLYACLLYNERVKLYTNILCQLCLGINRLNKYLARINIIKTE